jgi:hypothetical protein
MWLMIVTTVGLTFGIATWGLLRGRGGWLGFLMCALFGVVGAAIGALAAQAIWHTGSQRVAALGAVVGALLAVIVEGLGFGPRPKHVDWADRRGVAPTPHDPGEARSATH